MVNTTINNSDGRNLIIAETKTKQAEIIGRRGNIMKKIILPSQMMMVIPLLFVALLYSCNFAMATVGGDLFWETVDAQGGKQQAAASILDSNGNAYVTGFSQAIGGDDDFYTIKVDNAGVVQWHKSFDIGSEDDRPISIAFDSSGNVIVAGYGSVGGNINIIVIKYDAATGDELWTQPLVYDSAVGGSDYPAALTVDSDDNIYVAGYSQSASGTDDGLILKLASDGSLIRAVHFDAGADMDDRFTSIAAGNDTAGIPDDDFIVVSGYTWVDHGSRQDFDILTLKFNAGGVEQWRGVYDGTSGDDRGLFVSVDSAYDVVVSGYVTTGTRKDIKTIKYGAYGDGNGGDTILWQKSYSGGEQNIPHGLWLDQASGDVFITGAVFNNSGMDDFYTAGYASSDGMLLWDQVYDSPGSEQKDIPTAITGDGVGGLYVTGYVEDGVSGNKDLLTLKYYQKNGHLLWHDRHDGPFGGIQEAVQVAVALNVSPAGNLFVAGWSGVVTDFSTGTATETAVDNYTIKDTDQISWNSDQWHYYYVLMTSGANQGESRRISSNSGDTLTLESALPYPVQLGDTFTINNPFDYDYYVVNYNRGLVNPPTGLNATVLSGNEIDLTWVDNSPVVSEDDFCIERCIGFACQDFTEITCIPADTGTSPAQAYQDTGVTATTRYSYRVRTKKRGTADYSGYSDLVNVFSNVFNPASPTWLYTYDSPDNSNDEVRAIAVGPDNDPVVTGSSNSLTGQFDYYTVKINHSNPLDEKWSHRYDDPDNQTDIATCLAVDGDSGVFVSGYSSLFSGGTSNTNDIFSLKFAAAGPDPYNLDFNHNYGAVWMAQYSGPGGGDDRAEAVDSASDGSADVVVGYGKNVAGNDDIYVVKYLADGALAWAAVPFDGVAGQRDVPTDVFIDPAGDILVSGITNNGSNEDIFLRKYSGIDGSTMWTLLYDSGYGNDGLNSVTTDTVGNVYAVGYVTNAAGNLDMYFSKYDKDGNADGTAKELWTNLIGGDGIGYDEAVSISYDAGVNEVLIAGMVTSATGSIDYQVRCYAINGNMIWKRTLDHSSADDFLVGMTIDRDGNICLAGNTDNGTNTDILSVCYDSGGNMTGSNLFNGAANQDDVAAAMTINPLGETFIAGYTVNSAGNRDYLVMKAESNTLQAPSNFTAASRYTTADLSWTDNSPDEESFYIWRKDGACADGGSYNNIYMSAPNEISFTDTGLTEGGTYCYRLQAMKGGISSLPVEIESQTSMLPSPACNAVVTGTTQIDLSWTDATNSAEGIDVLRCSGLDCSNFSDLASLTSGTESYNDISSCELLSNNSEPYSYRVRIYNNTENWQVFSDCPNVYPQEAKVLTNFSANPVSEGEVELHWLDPNSDSSQYKIYKCEDTGSGCTPAYLTTITNVLVPVGELMELQMDESVWTGAAGEIIDTSTNGINGTALNGAAATIAGHTSGAGSFDGVDDQVQWAYPNGLPYNNFTMMAWVKAVDLHEVDSQSITTTTGTSGQHWLFGPDMPASTDESGAGVSVGTNGISVYEHSGGYMPPLAVYNANIGTGWNHITVTYTNGQPRIYLNGVLVITGYPSPKTKVYAPQKVGGGPYGNFHGIIDEVRIFDRALSDSEVANIASTPGLSVLYKTYMDSGTDVFPGHNYKYQVTANKTATCNWEVAPVSASATPTLLSPCPFNAVASNTNTVNLNWTDNFGTEDGYLVDRCQGADCLSTCDVDSANCRLGAIASGNVSAIDYNVVPGTTYSYQVQAYKGTSGAWLWLSPCTTNITMPVPIAPNNLLATRYSEQETSLIWNDTNDDETGFDIERCEVGVDCPSYVSIGSAPATTGQGSFIDKGPSANGLLPDHTYRYRVRAVKSAAAGWPSAYSNESEATPSIIAPDGLKAKTVNAGRVDLTWINHTTWETRFSIGRCAGSGCSDFAEVGSAAAGSNTFVDVTACADATYTYQITAVNSIWPLNPVTALTAEASTPTIVAPYALTLSPVSESEVDMSWLDANTVSDGFTIERCDDTEANCTAGISTYNSVGNVDTGFSLAPPNDYTLHYAMDDPGWVNTKDDEVKDSAGSNPGKPYYVNNVAGSVIKGAEANFYRSLYSYIKMKNPIVLNRYHSTLSWWMKPNTTTDTGLFSRNFSGGLLSIIESRSWGLYAESDNNCNTFSFVGIPKTKEWTMYSIVFDNAHAFLYVNGEYFGETSDYGHNNCDDTAPLTELIADTTIQYIGSGTGYTSTHYTGFMDEIGVFDRALTAPEIKAMHDSMATKFTLNFDGTGWNGTAGEVTDSSYGGHPGTAHGNVAPVSVVGERHGVASFDGDDDYISLGDINELDNPPAFTVALWFYRTADLASTPGHGVQNILLAQSSDTNNDNLEIGSSGTALEIYVDSASGADSTKVVEANIQNNIWYHLVMTYNENDANHLKLYLDGKLLGQWTDYSGYLNPSAASQLTLGIALPESSLLGDFSGYMDDVSIFSHPLSAAQVDKLYHGVYTEVGLNPLATYTFRINTHKDTACVWNMTGAPVEVTMPAPPGPTNLVANTVSTTQIDLTWLDKAGSETAYKVLRCQGASCTNYVEIASLAANSEAYSDTSLCTPDTYRYRVAAVVNGTDVMDQDGPVAAAPLLPAVPGNLTADSPSETEAHLSWDDNMSEESGYKIERCLGSGCVSTQADIVSEMDYDFVDDFTTGIDANSWLQYGVVETITSSTPPIDISDTFGTATISAVNGAVDMITTSTGIGADTTYNYARMQGSSSMLTALGSGDFDVHVDYSMPDGNISTALTQNFIPIRLQINLGADFFYIERVFNNGSNYYGAYAMVNSVAASNSLSTSDTSGKLRLTRVGNTLSCYAWTGGAWTSIYSVQLVTSGVVPNWVIITQYAERNEAVSLHTIIDNFTYTSAAVNNYNYTDRGLTPPDSTYIYKVYPFKGSCLWDQNYSAQVEVTNLVIPPANLAVDMLNSTEVDVKWTDTTTSETGFELERCAGICTAADTFVKISDNGADINSYVDNTLVPGTAYSYRVRAVNSTLSWASAYSNILTVTTNAVAAPVNLVNNPGSEIRVELAWDMNYSDESSVVIQRGDAGCANFSSLPALPAGTTSYTDTSVTESTTYCYQVQVCKDDIDPGAGDNSWCSPFSGQALATTTIASPDPLVVTFLNSTQSNLQWTNTTESETGFVVERCEGSGCSSFTELTGSPVGADITTFTDTGICSGTVYNYRVKAVNGSQWSSPYTTPVEITSSTPVAVTDLAALELVDSQDNRQINISWTDTNLDEDGFSLERCEGAGCSDFLSIATLPSLEDLTLGIDPAFWSQSAWLETVSSTTLPIDISDASGDATITDTNDGVDFRVSTNGGGTGFSAAKLYMVDPGGLGNNDFDVRVDYNLPDGQLGVVGVDHEYMRLRISFPDPDGSGPLLYDYIIVAHKATAAGDKYMMTMRVNNVTTYDEAFTNDTSGTLRITRKGNVLQGFAWTFGGWAKGPASDPIIGDEVPDSLNYGPNANRAEAVSLHTLVTDFRITNIYSDNNILPSTDYCYRVTPTKSAGCAWDPVADNLYSVVCSKTAPAAPSNLISTVDGMSISLDWDDNSLDEDGFEIEKKLVNGRFIVLDTVGPGVKTYTNSTWIEPNTSYTYRVRAVRGSDKSAYSNEIIGTTMDWQAPICVP